ncbi:MULTISPECIES: Holliday junction resolvase RecU [Sporosarcina]|uniref:Holliday junction resolvase RecU n=1 Tax=Sporosarcina TaxID=1569 RepID=UPI00058EFED3|nr:MULTISPECIES: Holliday junction resolvase RecU [Sporosarcina]WJY28564.1 Holliday junction resolvase RecU [Sporosarcina sp. 0.2-SM1T-5]
MAIRYPNGKKYTPAAAEPHAKKAQLSFSNRGKTLEDELNDSNEFYNSRRIAVIHKKPVPIQIVNVRYPARSAAVITEAYFKTASTTDYNGIWNGKYVDFEAKETKNRTSFPLKNIHDHQVDHMQQVHDQGGITFLIIRFAQLDRYFVLPFAPFRDKWERMQNGGRKSMTLSEIEDLSIELTPGYQPRLDYLQALNALTESERTERQES